jgi:hypothetical protein
MPHDTSPHRQRPVVPRALALALLVLAMLAPLGPSAQATPHSSARLSPPDLPAVDPDYIYDQLSTMVTHFQRREAGFDANLPVGQNGHDEFATYWQQEMLRDLAGFGASARRDSFDDPGWRSRAATVAAFNVEVTVPGLTHPEQQVVIGCHYDGEATSTQSANDDASGCAIELGVAKAMATYWKARHVYPTRTLRFVAFDAEEQGLYGSIHYLNDTINGDVSSVVAMINEEQSGIAYPLRFLGKASNPVLPLDDVLSPLQSNDAYPGQSRLPPAQLDAIARFRDLMPQAITAVFAEFQALGHATLGYRDASGSPTPQPIFAPGDTGNIHIQDDTGIGSDQIPFTTAGVPCATFVGNATYYDTTAPPPWSYPYDQPQDTIQLMNTYANDTAEEAPALTLSLALPGMLTTWLLAQPSVLGATPADGAPLAALGDLGQTLTGKSLTFDASASYDPAASAALTYAWDFGDSATATGATVTHTYSTPGPYTLKLTVAGPTGTRQLSRSLNVTDAPAFQIPPYPYKPTGAPRPNPLVTLPQPRYGGGTPPPATSQFVPSRPAWPWLAGGLALLFVMAILVVIAARRRVATATSSSAEPTLTAEDEAARRRRASALDAMLRDNENGTHG